MTRNLAVIALAGVCGALFASGCTRAPKLPQGVEIALRNHFEAEISADGEVVPCFEREYPNVGVCLAAPSELDTSRWQARIGFEDGTPSDLTIESAPWSAPTIRQETTLCFAREFPPSASVATPSTLCFEVRDAFDGREFGRICRTIHFRDRKEATDPMVAERQRLLSGGWSERGFLVWLDDLEALAARADGAKRPFFATQMRLIGIDLARRQGNAEAFTRGERLIAALPRWLDHSEASDLGGQAAYVTAEFALAQGRSLESSWESLREADRRYLRIASDLRFTVAMRQGAILGEMGAAREGAARLRRALAERATPEDGSIQDLIAGAEGELAWLLLLDPQAPPEDIAEANQLIERASQRKSALADPVEDANLALNRAYLALRGEDYQTIEGELRQARGALGSAPPSSRREMLAAWADLLGGLAAEARGDASSALVLCRRPADRVDLPRLAAWGSSCLGSAARRLGDLGAAQSQLDRALALHEQATSARWSQEVPIGPGQRADDFYRAARIAVERRQPDLAWAILDRLDALAANEEDKRGCAARLAPPERARLATAERERDRLMAELEALGAPASAARRRQLESTRRALSERLQEISRRELPCAPSPHPSTADLRAVALDDEVVLLSRDSTGAVSVARRTALPRRELARIVRAIESALEARTLDDEAWRKLTAPLTAALAPPQVFDATIAPHPARPIVYALHGPLQGVPLAALPLSEGGWLADRALPTFQPAAPAPSPGSSDLSIPSERGLFVVDPRGNLPAGGQSGRFYRESFSRAEVLMGAQATVHAIEAALGRASFLHVDAHGNYDPAFPELSSLGLADGPLSFGRLAELPVPRALVNLSGCRTGGWPITADSGRYGLAGLCARRGARWAIGSRGDLDDGFAAEFNQIFYQHLRRGASVPEGFSAALEETRSKRRAAVWGGLLLIAGTNVGSSGGQTDPLPTPFGK